MSKPRFRNRQAKMSGQGAWASRPCGAPSFDAITGLPTGETPVLPEMVLRGFTLIELLVVVAIVAVLAALGIPAVRTGIARADSAKCLGNLRMIGAGLNAWLADHNMTMPPLAAGRKTRDENVPVIDTVLAPYLPDPRVFACPADKSQAAQTGTSYYWNSVLSGQSAANLNFLALATDLSKIPVVLDKEGWHYYSPDKVNHLFADGHASNQLRLFAAP